MFFLKLNFQDEGQLYANSLFYIHTVQGKCLGFEFLSSGLHMHMSILTVVQNGRFTSRKIGDTFLKNVLLEA